MNNIIIIFIVILVLFFIWKLNDKKIERHDTGALIQLVSKDAQDRYLINDDWQYDPYYSYYPNYPYYYPYYYYPTY
jgi:hypothetical protein